MLSAENTSCLQERQHYSFLRKSTHPLHFVFSKETHCHVFFKSNAMKSSTWISNVFESLVSSLVTMYRSTSFSQNRIIF